MNKNRFLIIMPAYNEEQNLGRVLDELLGLQLPSDILVVNDGSLDRTQEVAEAYPVTVIAHPYNLGYGAALQTGYKYAVAKAYDFVLQYDADGQHNPHDLPPLMREMEDGDVDIVIGSRYLEDSGSFPTGAMKMFGVHFFRWLIRTLTGVRISDPTSGFRGISRRVFGYYAVRDRFPADFPDADILIQQILSNYRILEIPTHMRLREAGVSMHAGLKPLLYMLKMSLAILIVLMQRKKWRQVASHE